MLPKEWKIKNLDSIFRVFDSLHQTPTFSDAGYPMVRVADVNGANLDLSNTAMVSVDVFMDFTKKYRPKRNDIVFSRVGSYGISAFVDTDEPFCLGQNTVIAESNDSADPKYVFYVLKSNYIKRQIERTVDGSSHKTISLKVIRNLELPVPELPEQKKIAKTLSTWDQTIATTERLLDLARQQKKALMQQLLTGKKRFPGFEGEWRNLPLCKMAEVIVSPVDKKTEPNEFAVELCNYTDVYYNHQITRKINFMRATATKAEIEKYTLQKGDVIITKDSETPGDIAVPVLVAEDLNGVICGYHLAIIRPDNNCVDGAFLNYLFSMQKTRYYFFTLATGATRFGLSVGAINHAYFNIPSIDEQKKVASVLSAADQEIEILQSQLDGLKQEKKALMQALLTGKRRVSVDE